MPRELYVEPLRPDTFAPFGDVIEERAESEVMNDARFARFDELCAVDTDGAVGVAIARCEQASRLPYEITLLERHPLGSQAFVPLDGQQFVVVVAPAGEAPTAESLRAFLSNGRQGVNYARGTWHMPLIGLASGQRFLVIDRGAASGNCEEHLLADPVMLNVPA